MTKTTFRFSFALSVLCVALGTGVMTAAQSALPYPNRATPPAVDRGELASQPGTTPISITVALKLRDFDEAESLLTALHTPGNPQFHQFLTAQQFAARFAPRDADVAKVIAALAKYGLAAARTTATTLTVTGLPADLERAFAVSLHSYEVAAHDRAPGYTFHAPLGRATIPSEISAAISAVVGLDSRPSFQPRNAVAHQSRARTAVAANTAQGNAPGLWTVTDFANYYDVEPLYKNGLSGSGRTIGIITFASFTPSDAYSYWQAAGLKVSPHRIKILNIDGGPGAPSDASGSVETSLDVEQSGGIAPGAKIIVYQGTNTNQGFLDSFATAIDSNRAETLSVSWGDWEWCTKLEHSSFNCPTTPPDPGYIRAVHHLLVRAAIQGQTAFAASGDDGAYDNSGDCASSQICSNTLTVDAPADDTAITAAGGTTLPGLQEYCLNSACTPPFYDVNIPNERVWGWDYLIGLCQTLGFDPVACGIFPKGSGGGVSIIFPRPPYQSHVPGIQRSQPDQNYTVNGELILALPPYFPGRNVPDISFNADPDTGYVIYYTSDQTGFGIDSFYGGTSFVAPQLNGVSALLGQDVHSRLGLLNYPLYYLAQTGRAYRGHDAPLHAIVDGDNWFYHGSNSYNPAVGLGTMDVANFAGYLRSLF